MQALVTRLKRDPLFEPLEINGVVFKNRIFRSSIGGALDHYNGSMSQARIAWDARFARGGVGAIFSSHAVVHRQAAVMPGFAMIDDDSKIAAWRMLIRRVQQYDCRYIVQLFHAGRQRDVARRDLLGTVPASSTARPDLLHGLPARVMTQQEIQNATVQFAQGARRAVLAGADGIEIHACNGYLLSQFLSSAINDRSDEYGGDLEHRARFLLEVVEAVRAEVGRDVFLSVKLSSRDAHNVMAYPLSRKAGNTLEDAILVSQWLKAAGVDAIHVSSGDSFPHPLTPAGGAASGELAHIYLRLYRQGRHSAALYHLLQFGWFQRLMEWLWTRRTPYYNRGKVDPQRVEGINQHDASAIRVAAGLPVICVGGWQNAEPMRNAIAESACDAVSLARALLATPDLPLRFRAGEQSPPKPCTYCNKCVVNVVNHPLACYELSRFPSEEAMYREAYSVFEEAQVDMVLETGRQRASDVVPRQDRIAPGFPR